jgi:hypothetical protein
MRYFFHVQDGQYYPDETGTELPDLAAVRDEAIGVTAELLRGAGRAEFWTGEDWSLHVTDDAGGDVLTLRFSAMPAAIISAR